MKIKRSYVAVTVGVIAEQGLCNVSMQRELPSASRSVKSKPAEFSEFPELEFEYLRERGVLAIPSFASSNAVSERTSELSTSKGSVAAEFPASDISFNCYSKPPIICKPPIHRSHFLFPKLSSKSEFRCISLYFINYGGGGGQPHFTSSQFCLFWLPE